MIEVYDLRRLPEDGETIDEALEQAWLAQQLGRDADVELNPLGDGHADIQLLPIGSPSPRGPVVRVTGILRARLSTPCVRCLIDVVLALEARPDLTLFPAPAVDDDRRNTSEKPSRAKDKDEADPVDPDEADSGTYTQQRIDLPSIVRETLLLEIPMNPACPDEAACAARTTVLIASVTPPDEAETLDPRWAALAALKSKLS